MPGKKKPSEKTSIIRRGLLGMIKTIGMTVGVINRTVGVINRTAGAVTSKVFSITRISRSSNKAKSAYRCENCRINRDRTENQTHSKPRTGVTSAREPDRKAGEVKFYRKLLDKANFRLSAHKEIFGQAIHNLTEKRNDRVARLNAVRLLSRIPGEIPLSILIRLTRDEWEKTRTEAIGTLATMNNVGLAIFAHALKDEDVHVRLAAIRGIHKRNGKESNGLLLDALEDENAAVKRRAVLCLGWRQDAKTTLRIAALLKNEDVYVKKAAAAALGSMKAKPAAEFLIEAIGDEDVGVRKAAHRALEKITGQSFMLDGDASKKILAEARAKWKEYLYKPPAKKARRSTHTEEDT